MKLSRIYIVLLGALLVLVSLIQASAPQEVNWLPSFSGSDKAPYGAYLLRELLPQVIGHHEVTVTEKPIYNTLSGVEAETTYLLINDDWDADDLELRELCEFVRAGNTAFIIAETYPQAFKDTLHFNVYRTMLLDDEGGISLVNPRLNDSIEYRYKKYSNGYAYFTEFDTAGTIVLGKNSHGDFNFVRMRFGAGSFYLGVNPFVFTNYNLLDTSAAVYAFSALSYLPKQDLIWDEYYKSGRRVAAKPMRYVLHQESLRWAFYTAIIGVVLFIVFEGKRRQRTIPIIKPPTNSSLEFVETVGRLYYQHGDHKNLAEKKIQYFLEYLRTSFGVNTSRRDDDFYRALAARSGVDLEAARRVFIRIDTTSVRNALDQYELGELNEAIEEFHRQVTR